MLAWSSKEDDAACGPYSGTETVEGKESVCNDRHALYLDSGSNGFVLSNNTIGVGNTVLIKGTRNAMEGEVCSA